MPAKAGIQLAVLFDFTAWTPAFAGVTNVKHYTSAGFFYGPLFERRDAPQPRKQRKAPDNRGLSRFARDAMPTARISRIA
jgi:hypothetical protein